MSDRHDSLGADDLRADDLRADDLRADESVDQIVDQIVSQVVSQVVSAALDSPPPHQPATPLPTAEDLKLLHDRAVHAVKTAVAGAEQDEARELAAMGQRLRAEQDRLYARIMGDLPAAVTQAAAAGQRVATVMRFGGSDRLEEFCFLYMLKGPVKAEQRAEMRAMGASPLLPRLRRELGAAGFGVFHTWQRATNENTLSVSW